MGTRFVDPDGRNKRSVWTVSTKPFRGAHFATFPPELILPCILAGSPPAGVVLDPFMGSGTTGYVAKKYARHFIGIELNPEYLELARTRIQNIPDTFPLSHHPAQKHTP
jgi:DNA modification methylase